MAGEYGEAPPVRREFRRMLVGSTLAHVGLLGLVLATPGSSKMASPQVIAIDLVAPPSAAGRPAPAPKPVQQAKAAPAPKPAEVLPPPEPPKPKPVQKEVVLPEKPTAPKKPEAEAKPKPREREVFREPEKKQEKSLEDLLAEMREGEEPPQPVETAAEPMETAALPSPGAPGGQGPMLSAEERDWHARVRRKMKDVWVVPPGFRTQPLETEVEVTLDAAGNILGAPRVSRRSGNPWYDDGVIRGLDKAKALPPPPSPGEWTLVFRPEDAL